MTPEHESRPGTAPEAANENPAKVHRHPTDEGHRCRRCRRRIWAARSVSRRHGPVCHRRNRADAEAAAA